MITLDNWRQQWLNIDDTISEKIDDLSQQGLDPESISREITAFKKNLVPQGKTHWRFMIAQPLLDNISHVLDASRFDFTMPPSEDGTPCINVVFVMGANSLLASLVPEDLSGDEGLSAPILSLIDSETGDRIPLPNKGSALDYVTLFKKHGIYSE
jgi:hypothetical protein